MTLLSVCHIFSCAALFFTHKLARSWKHLSSRFNDMFWSFPLRISLKHCSISFVLTIRFWNDDPFVHIIFRCFTHSWYNSSKTSLSFSSFLAWWTSCTKVTATNMVESSNSAMSRSFLKVIKCFRYVIKLCGLTHLENSLICFKRLSKSMFCLSTCDFQFLFTSKAERKTHEFKLQRKCSQEIAKTCSKKLFQRNMQSRDNRVDNKFLCLCKFKLLCVLLFSALLDSIALSVCKLFSITFHSFAYSRLLWLHTTLSLVCTSNICGE